MPGGRLRVVLGVALVVAVVAVVVAVDERRERSALEERVARGEERRRAAEREQAAATTVPEPRETPAGAAGAEDLVVRLLESILGPGSGLFASSALQECASALGGAGGGTRGSGGLLGGGGGGPADPEAQLQEVAGDLEALRGLRFRRVPDPDFVSPAELSRRVQEQVAEDLPADVAAREARGLVALGALEEGADLRALTLQAVGEQVAGYYDPESGDMVVRRDGAQGPLDGQARMVLAHELDHALTDQVLDLPVEVDRPPPGGEDAALARLALVEGDATLAMQVYALRHVGLLEQLGGLAGAVGAGEQLAALPHHLRRSLVFPYLQGLSFACALHAEGGWRAVDRAYADPPSTTAQVLFPERYAAREPAVDPRDPPAPGGWKADPPRALGAAELMWLLEAPGGDAGRALDDPAGRVGAWAGGELHAWADGGRTAAAVALVERPGASPSLCATVAAWYRAAFPDGRPAAAGEGEELAVDGPAQDAVLRCSGRDVRLGLGPDVATARALAR